MIYVIGGIAVDVIVEKEKFIPNTSNISNIYFDIGGVGFNIFRNISIYDKTLITVIAKDERFLLIKSKLEKYGLGSRINFIIDPSGKTAIYIALMENGELFIGNSDFEIIELNLKFDKILPFIEFAQPLDLVVFDSNIVPEELDKLFSYLANKGCRIIFEPVSVEKMERILPVIKDIFILTPDTQEFEVIKTKYPDIFEFMMTRNIEYIIRTRGKQGISLYIKSKTKRIDIVPEVIGDFKNTTGAGDFLVAKIAESIYKLKRSEVNEQEFINLIRFAMKETYHFLQAINY